MTYRATRKGLLPGIALFAALHAAEGMAAATPEPANMATLQQQLQEASRKLAEQQEMLELQFKKLESQRQALEDTRRRVAAMQAQMGIQVDEPIRATPQEVARASGRGPDEAAPVANLDVAQVFNQPSILTPKGGLVLEPGLQYSYSSSNRVDVVGYSILNSVLLGLIDVRNVSQSTWMASLSGRYGLTERLEVEAKIPFVYSSNDTISRPIDLSGGAQDQLFSADGSGLGDIELAARYQLNFPQGDAPIYIAGLRFKTATGTGPYDVAYNLDSDFRGSFPTEQPTGSGFYSLQPSLTVVLPADPAVFFGGINYIWNIEKDIDRTIAGTFVGTVDPGDSVGLNFGMGLALNERSSFSLGYEHSWIGKTTNDGQAAANTSSVQLASLLAGYSYRLNKDTNINLSVAAGLTPDTPATTVSLRVPMKF